jgi:soluble lytic murein transglycosylase
MQYKKFLSRGFLKKSKTTLTSAFLLVALPGISEFGSYPVRDEAEHVQRAIQLIEERDLLVSPSDSIRLTSAGITRKTAQIHQFVIEYTERSLRGEWKAHAPKIARAILDSSTRHGFDPLLLLAVIQNESSFNPTVIGMHGEIGLMQLKPDTAEWVAKKSRIRWTGADMLRDPIANVRLGTAYLSMLKAKFGFATSTACSAPTAIPRSIPSARSSTTRASTSSSSTVRSRSPRPRSRRSDRARSA